ncbi:phage tail protein [Dickeya dadantii]|uniref:phage tail protein n=1 Tax=Dickeya dadantii TaxID=204038 RepID=UPI0003A4BE6A|nr:phage tail protein [Dickeya dadantii]
MPDFKGQLAGLRLPSWMDKGEPAGLLNASKAYWLQVNDWLRWPLQQLDVDTCAEPLLNVLAYQRDISRLKGEALDLFRRRVKYAFVNAQDAGSVAGFIAIFERLGIGTVTLAERQPGYDWDVILVRINDEQLSGYNALMMSLVRQYGRTCRRYTFDLSNGETQSVRGGEFEHNAEYYHAISLMPVGTVTARVALRYARASASTEYYSANV